MDTRESAASPLPSRSAARGSWIGILLLAGALFLSGLGEGVLVEDPARYAAVSKSILETGDWTTLHEGPSRLYFNKPPLQFWLTALLFRLFGVSALTARLWSALAGMGTALLLYDAGRRLWNERTGLYAAVILCLSNDFVRYAAAGRLDAPQTFFQTLAVWAALRAVRGGNGLFAAFAGVAMGLGLLAKGPMALVVLPPILLLLFCLPKRFVRLGGAGRDGAVLPKKRLGPFFLPGALLGALPFALWLFAMARAHPFLSAQEPGFLSHFFGHEMMDRLEWLEPKSRLHFVGVLLEKFLPWTLFALAGLTGMGVRLWRRRGGSDEETSRAADRFLLLWLGCLLAASFLPPRMYGRYLVMVYPPLALLSARAAGEWTGERFAAGLRRLLPVVAVVAALALPFARREEDTEYRLRAAMEQLHEVIPPGERVPLFHVEVHAPEAVVYLYSGREARSMQSLEEALAYPWILTSPGGFEQLAPFGYGRAVSAEKLVLARRAEAP